MRSGKIKADFILMLIVGSVLPLGVVHAQNGDARVGFFTEFEVKPGERIDVPVEIKGVEDLYAIDLQIQFDPEILMVEDADPNTEGVQPALGTFLDAGILLYNTADNETGVIRLVMSQVNPSEPRSGDGIILVLYLKGLVEGECPLEVTNLQLSTRRGEEIPAESEDGVVTVSEDAEEKDTTPIPVQTPTIVTLTTPEQTQVVPTSTPTSTATWTLTPTERFTDTEEPVASITDTPATLQETSTRTATVADRQDRENQVAEISQDRQEGFSLLQYWWIVVLVLVLALGMGAYLWRTRK